MSERALKQAVLSYRVETAGTFEAEIAVIEAGLDRHGAQLFGDTRALCLVLAYADETLCGGLHAYSLGSNFYIKHLWVDEAYRGKGVALTIMEKAEAEARARGCRTAWVDTMSYQAPGFYERCGYGERARVPGYRDSHDRIFFAKEV